MQRGLIVSVPLAGFVLFASRVREVRREKEQTKVSRRCAFDMTPALLSVLCALYASEIKVSIGISACWDEGWEVKLGNRVNGFVAEKAGRTGECPLSRIRFCSKIYSVPFDQAASKLIAKGLKRGCLSLMSRQRRDA